MEVSLDLSAMGESHHSSTLSPSAPLSPLSLSFSHPATPRAALTPVIKLFNAILVASKTAEEATTSLSARAGVKDEKPKGKKEKDNIMGRGGKAAPLTQESFLDLVRKG